jgi:hypothetical protein
MDDGRSVEAVEAAIHLEATSLNLYDGYHRYAAVHLLGTTTFLPQRIHLDPDHRYAAVHLLGTTTFLPQRIHLDPAAVHLFVSTAIFLPQRNQLDPEATSLEEAGPGGFIADMINSAINVDPFMMRVMTDQLLLLE